LALDNEEGERICGALADADIMFMANHGVIVCGEPVAYVERACMVQVLAMSTGKPLRYVFQNGCHEHGKTVRVGTPAIHVAFRGAQKRSRSPGPGLV